jgi:outer membrane protein assembly factor BamB
MTRRRLFLLSFVAVCAAVPIVLVYEFRPQIRRWKAVVIERSNPVDSIERTAPVEANPPPYRFAANDWPCWRGADGSGVNREAGPFPITWSPTKNVEWKTLIPGRGHASPVVVGDAVFLATADAETQSLVCLDRRTGAHRWTTTLFRGGIMGGNPKNSQASPTPATDGELVYVLLQNGGSVHLTAVDHSGAVRWSRPLGPYSPDHGLGSSPLLHREMVLVLADCSAGGFAAAVHRLTGEILWRARHPGGSNYCTPVLTSFAGNTALVLAGGGVVDALDPAHGTAAWTCNAGAATIGNTLASDSERVYVSGGFPEKKVQAIALEPSPNNRVVWTVEQSSQVAYVPSPIVEGGLLYLLNDGGVLSCLAAASGEKKWSKRVPGSYTSSPLFAGGRLYVVNEEGRTSVLKTSASKAEVEATNDLDEECYATPVAAGGRIYLRTLKHLYCLGAFGAKP